MIDLKCHHHESIGGGLPYRHCEAGAPDTFPPNMCVENRKSTHSCVACLGQVLAKRLPLHIKPRTWPLIRSEESSSRAVDFSPGSHPPTDAMSPTHWLYTWNVTRAVKNRGKSIDRKTVFYPAFYMKDGLLDVRNSTF